MIIPINMTYFPKQQEPSGLYNADVQVVCSFEVGNGII
jgi:hypothetical protein